MTTNYTDAQIEDQCVQLKQLEQMGDSFRVIHSEFRSLHDMLRSLLSERQAAMQGQGGEVLINVLSYDEVEWLNYAIAHMHDDSEPEDKTCADVLQMLLDRTHYPSVQPPQPVQSVSDEDAKYAARYRWIRTHCVFANDRHLERGEEDTLDRQIDAAIAQEKQS